MNPHDSALSDSAHRIIWKHPLFAIALGFGAGLVPSAPGTIATLWAWLAFLVIDPLMNDVAWAALILFAMVVGVKACTSAGKALGRADAPCIVWDEIVAFWCVLWMLPRLSDPAGFQMLAGIPEWLIQLVAFGVFRFFDIVKPPPIGRIDRMSRDGIGVMADDLVAAAYTLLVCAIFLRMTHYIVGWIT